MEQSLQQVKFSRVSILVLLICLLFIIKHVLFSYENLLHANFINHNNHGVTESSDKYVINLPEIEYFLCQIDSMKDMPKDKRFRQKS